MNENAGGSPSDAGDANAAPALELDGVVAGYPDRTVLDGVTLRVARGERVALIGPNGAGKSTLIAVATGLLRPSRGRVSLFGRDAGGLSAVERARLAAVVPQDIDASAPFTVAEMVMLGRHATLGRWSPPGEADRAAVSEAMARTETAALADRQFLALSGGERQRVCIAMALASNAPLIFMDEPTSHLDLKHHASVARLVGELNREGKTIVFVAHDLNLAAEYFDRIAVVESGRIRADGAPEEVLSAGLLSEVYGCGISIHRDPESGSLRIFPRCRA